MLLQFRRLSILYTNDSGDLLLHEPVSLEKMVSQRE